MRKMNKVRNGDGEMLVALKTRNREIWQGVLAMKEGKRKNADGSGANN